MFQFHQTTLQTGETVVQFATWLLKMAVNWEFHNVEGAAIIQNCRSKRLRDMPSPHSWKPDGQAKYKLQRWRKSCPSKESEDSVNAIKGYPNRQFQQGSHLTKTPTTCRKCGKTWPHKQGPCPAQGQTCNKCGKQNHFAKMCLTLASQIKDTSRSQGIKAVLSENESSDSEDEFSIPRARTDRRFLLWR